MTSTRIKMTATGTSARDNSGDGALRRSTPENLSAASVINRLLLRRAYIWHSRHDLVHHEGSKDTKVSDDQNSELRALPVLRGESLLVLTCRLRAGSPPALFAFRHSSLSTPAIQAS